LQGRQGPHRRHDLLLPALQRPLHQVWILLISISAVKFSGEKIIL
jgi:hypothetical protein